MNQVRWMVVAGTLVCACAFPCLAEGESAAAAPPPAEKRLPPPVILSGYTRQGEIKDAALRAHVEKIGHLMRGLAIFDQGKWRAVAHGELTPLVPVGIPLFDMSDPARVFTYSSVFSAEGCCGEMIENEMLVCPAPERPELHGRVVVSQYAWHSLVRPAKDPPAVEELSRRMLVELAPIEQDSRTISSRAYDSGKPYDPGKLRAPELAEALEFEIAPGEPVFLVTLRQRYGDDSRMNCRWDLASYWRAVVFKNGLDVLWSAAWVAVEENKRPSCHDFLGVADVNGDRVTEVVMGISHYETSGMALYEYRDRKLKPVLELISDNGYIYYNDEDM